MLDNIDENFVIAINGEWGSGKTFFVRQVIELLSYLRIEDKCDFGKLHAILQRTELNNIKLSNKFATVYYNAWDYDDTEPLLSLLFSIAQISNKEDGYFVSKGWLDNIITAIDSIQLLKVNIGDIKEKLTPDNITKAICENNKLKSYITELLENILKQTESDKLVIFIDELDRCNPSFAINMLEKIKHIFTNDRFIFVFSTNLEQLSYTLKGYYGQGFNACHYLEKMFDYQIELNTVNYENYLKILNNYSGDIFNDIMRDMCEYYNFSLRQCNKYLQQSKLLKDYIISLNHFSWKYIKIINTLIPMLLAIKIHDIKKYSQIINGKGKQDFIKCVSDNIYIKEKIIQVINSNCSKNDDDLDNEIIVSLYETLFCYNQNNEDNIWASIFDYNPQIICELLTLASKRINYNTKQLVT